MNVLDEFRNRLPSKKKNTPSGWAAFNAVCCHHRGHSTDKRSRAGFKLNAEGGFSYSCFNCGFKASWSPGRVLSLNAKKLLEYSGASKDEIAKINLYTIKTKSDVPFERNKEKPVIENRKVELPEGAKPFSEWVENPSEEFLNVLNYLLERNPNLINWHEYYWTPEKEFNMNKRIIIPLTMEGSNWLYGYSARAIYDSIKPKYMAQYSNNGFLFGQENLFKPNRKIAIIVEGIFDAISIGGSATMKQYMSDRQIDTIKSSEKKIIIVPDRDDSGKTMVLQAIENKFSVSFPNWDKDIKDVADAVKKYGRLAALRQILDSVVDSRLKIQIKMKGWFNV